MIALLGWGSLLWDGDPTFDAQHSSWRFDGPVLPIEFSRISQKRLGALTLVIDPDHGTGIKVAWTESRRSDLLAAVKDLGLREGTASGVSSLVVATDPREGPTGAIGTWARNAGVDAVVWTSLASNFQRRTGAPFSVPNAVKYFEGLRGDARAQAVRYVANAPAFVRTPLRSALERHGLLGLQREHDGD